MKKKWNVLLYFNCLNGTKLLLKMKLLSFLLFLSVASIASTTYSQQTKFTLNLADVTVEEVLKKIEENSEFIFLYSEKTVDLSRKVKISADSQNINFILDQVFKGTNNYYEINDRQIAILSKKENSTPVKTQSPLVQPKDQNQKKTITGKVTDSKGESIPGVSVVVKGTTVGITTDVSGNYSLEVPVNSQFLSFSFVGMKTQEIPIGEQTNINVVLEEETVGIEEVVAIGYGIQKKSDVTGAIASVSSEDLANRSTTNVASGLQGKVSGLQVINNSGSPGSSSTLRVRGFSSNGNSDPLYIVDGLKVPNIDFLEPENIESMEILKDAASAAIYGAEAGNGVILITTKSGSDGEGKIFFNIQTTISNLAKNVELLNAEEYTTYMLEAAPEREEDLYKYYYNEPSSYINNKLVDTDWQNEFYEAGLRQRYNFGVQGGNNRGTYFVSLAYLDHEGIVIGSQDSYKRFSGQINGDYKIKKWLDVSTSNVIERSNSKKISENAVWYGATMSRLSLMDPLTPVEYEDGEAGASPWVREAIDNGNNLLINPETGNYYGVSYWSVENPIGTLQKNDTYSKTFGVNGTIDVNLKPLKNLVFTSRLGYRFNNFYSYDYQHPAWTSISSPESTMNMVVQQFGSVYYQWENFANYSFDIQKNSFSVLAGTSFNKIENDNLYVKTDELENDLENFRYIDYSTSTANDMVAGNTTERAQIAYYGRLSWSYDSKYYIQCNFRADSYDASKLDLSNSWGFFPSVSTGWTITNENFTQNINKEVLSFAKLRASYGVNGSISNLNGYMYASSLKTGANALGTSSYKYILNNQLHTGIYPDLFLANPELRWEESVQFDIGLDLRLFNNKLSFTADYFNKNTDGLLVLTTSSLITGTNYSWQNAGKINNKGYEFDLGWKETIGKDFKYEVHANIATVSNNVDEYLGENVRFGGTSLAGSTIPLSYFEEGYPVWYLRGFKVSSINSEDGRPIFEDISKDGQITDADKTLIGSGVPDFTYGMTLNLQYKSFDFILFGTGSHGSEIFYGISNLNNELQNRPKFLYEDRWTSDNTMAARPSAFFQNDPNYFYSDDFVFDGSFFKIKQIQLGYNIPAKFLSKIGATALRAYVSLDDWFTFTKYPGVDPEIRPESGNSGLSVTGTSGGVSAMAIDFGGYPIAKSTMFGLNLTF